MTNKNTIIEGVWIKHKENNEWYGFYECSVCGYVEGVKDKKCQKCKSKMLNEGMVLSDGRNHSWNEIWKELKESLQETLKKEAERKAVNE